MPVVRQRIAAVAVSTAVLVAVVPPAFAGGGRGGGDGGSVGEVPADPSGGAAKQSIYASVIQFDESKNGSGKSTGTVTPASDWTPPACWYEPKWTPAEFATEFQKEWDIPHASGVGEAYNLAQEHYKNGEPYTDFNESETGKGMWWDAVRDKDREEAGDPAAFECDTATFWVENGETPDVENAVTPEILAQLAYNRIKVPDTEVTLAPETVTKVNLPTWAWLDQAEFKEVSVTASLNVGGVNIQATTTAKPVSLKLEPGTVDAETYPASGECTFNNDGSIGEPYAEGKADRTPPCGIKYLRSSGDGTYKLQATITWEITWVGTGNPNPTALPDGTFGNEQNVTVQEIQSINR
ncbi:hypothetical protein [Streptomyces sp. NPDC060065]|uniref:hypothetical protein n=1 Tax=Streptomyces sp. NPDC060065 TaxID=3347050 RepID=UPI00369D12BE